MFQDLQTLQALKEFQPQAATSFKSAIQNNRLHHAYLLMCNQETITKEMALAVAQTLVCLTPSENGSACQQCAGCRKFAGGNHPDVLVLEPDEKRKIRITSIRNLTNRLNLRASEADTKVILIFGADHMNPAAQNALLKTLEEPPGKTCFILTAQRYRHLLPTIRSRVQRLQLTPPKPAKATAILEEAGIPKELASTLAALVGADVTSANEMLDAGLADILSEIRTLITTHSSANLLQLAADLGSSRERSQLAMRILEVVTRDGLAHKWGARHEQLHDHNNLTSGRFDQAASQIQQVRENQVMNPNPTMSVESVLLELTTQPESTISP